MPRTTIVKNGALALALSLFGAAVPAQARVALNEEPHVIGSLISAAIGAMIVEHCDEIEARKITALIKAWQLKNYALDLGYTSEEIDALLKSKPDKERVRAAAEAYLAENGVVADDASTYCALGRTEIAKDTLTGKLIRAN